MPLNDMKVYFTVFGGRKAYLSVLRPYLDELVRRGTVFEVHLWVFTVNEDDIQYMKEWAEKDMPATRCILFYPPNPYKKWEYYYDYYYRTCKENDVVVKCDDDIVYLDCNAFAEFVKRADDEHIWFPNIVNNDVCAYFQQKEGIHTLVEHGWMEQIEKRVCTNVRGDGRVITGWFSNQSSAVSIHELFLKEMNVGRGGDKGIRADGNQVHPFVRNKVHEYGNRISINCFAVKGKGIQRFFAHLRGTDVDDETRVGELPAFENTMHKIDMSCVVVHFQFAPQDVNGKMRQMYLGKYSELANMILS